MIQTPICPDQALENNSINALGDACSDFNTVRVLADASERLIDEIRQWVKMQPFALQTTVVDALADLDILIGELRSKAIAGAKAAEDICDAGLARRSGKS